MYPRLRAIVASACLALPGLCFAQEPPTVTPNGWFARINGTEVPTDVFDQTAREAFRTKFYHGTPPEAQVNYMLREVGESLIDQALLFREVELRKIEPDANEVNAELGKIEQRYGLSPSWIEQKERALPVLRAQFEKQSRIGKLERTIRNVSVSKDEILAFYNQNLNLFTEPSKNRASVILFRIDPSSASSAWEEALKQAETTKAEILAGADFSQLAKERSNDPSAANGGDLGYLHQGMLAPAIEDGLSSMQPGSVGGPVRTLEGYAVYRLDGRIPSELRDFASVENRAKELLLRQKSLDTWLAFLDGLRTTAQIEVGPAFVQIMQTPKPAAAPSK